MEERHIIVIGSTILVVVIVLLFLLQAKGNDNLFAGLDPSPSPGANSISMIQTITPSPITELQGGDIKVGTGSAVVAAGDTITVDYVGALTDGKVFDSSYVSKKPLTFQVGAGSVIQGFDRGVAGMKLGGKRKLIIPANLGYGAQGQGPIPPNSALIFEIELINIAPKTTPTPEKTETPTPSLSPTPNP